MAIRAHKNHFVKKRKGELFGKLLILQDLKKRWGIQNQVVHTIYGFQFPGKHFILWNKRLRLCTSSFSQQIEELPCI